MRAWQQLKNIYHLIQAWAWRLWYDRPDQGLTIYGVTGTNGKTTTCYLLASILQAAHGKSKVGMLTTVAFWIGETEIMNETKMTTLKSRTVFKYLAAMKKAGVTHVALEITSHALDQFRLRGIQLHGAIITNIAREHLDYHRTMKEYAAAKEEIVNYLAPGAPLIGKQDDKLVGPILDRARKRNVDVVAFTAAQAEPMQSPLKGSVNKENVLMARLLAQKIGIATEKISQGIAAITQIPGRMEWVDLPNGARAVIDYAVTPDALDRLYKEVREQTTGKVFGVLGAAGLRDRGKRADMARAAAKYADELIISREDPWTESEEQIFNDLEKGLADTKTKWQRITDRKEALQYCITHVKAGDIIIATGKGAERGMAVGRKIIPWNEREIILELAKAV